jgi:RNA polymerase sigma-70 factor, ECF subfamily
VSTVCVTDADLVDRARQGDTAAFGELVDRHRVAVYRAAFAALGSPAEAEDAAQDAFLLAYRRLESFRGEASFKTWLLTITWHQAINRRRTLTRLWRRIASAPRDSDEGATGDPGYNDALLESVPASGPTPEARALDAELTRAVQDEIRALSPTLRDALLLAQSGEHSYEEIGVMMKAPIGTIKWRVSEARRRVKRRLQERGLRHDAAGR